MTPPAISRLDRDDDAVVEDDGLDGMSNVNRPRISDRCCFCIPRCCSCTYRVPTLRELWDRDRRLLRSVLVIAVLLNVPVGKYALYPFMLFSTWIHESFHGLAALSIGGRVSYLNIYPDGSGLAFTEIPVGRWSGLARAWVASAGYQGTALTGGVLLMFRRTSMGARIGTVAAGLLVLASCALVVRNPFGLAALIPSGLGLAVGGWKLPPFWVGELYASLAAATCLNAVTSVRVLFFVTQATIGGVVRSSDAMTMENVTGVPHLVWATIWMALALWMTLLGVSIVVETPGVEGGKEGSADREAPSSSEGRPLALDVLL